LRAAVAVLLVILGPLVAAAQTPGLVASDLPAPESSVYAAEEPGRALKDGKVLRAFRIAATPPTIDGSLNDEVWSFAESAGNYVQRDPDNGNPMTESTRMQVAYDDRYLYVAILCADSAPAEIAAGLGRRDELPATDSVSVGFDPRHDHLTAYAFQTNPSAVQADFSVSDDDRIDREYNAVWEVQTQMAPNGWMAEFRIPFSQMRFTVSPERGQVWGFQAERVIRRKGEQGTWVAKPRGERGEVSLYGHLVFDTPLPAARRIEIVPYTLARGERGGASDDAAEFGAAAGADMLIGLGSAATLAVTVNPDFGQVEQDPAVLNLSVFETFYPEKRPFFLEDNRTFVPPYFMFQLFHSRRIGRAPGHFAVDSDDDVLERSDETTILGAAKVTGKSGAWTYGSLTAATGREYATVEAQAGRRYEHLAEPLTSYNVVRLQRDVWGGSSNVGALATGVVREKSDDAFTGGFDYNLRWDQNRATFNGHWVATRAPGDGGVRTSGGGVSNFNFTRKHWGTWSHFDRFGRDFRVNDIGFFRNRANRNGADGGIFVEQPDPGRALRRFGGNLCGGQGWNSDVIFDRWVCTNGFVGFLNFWEARGGVTRRFRTLNDVDTRGGPPIVEPAATFYWFNVESDSRKSWRVNFGGNGKRGSIKSDGERALYTSLSLQPSGRLQTSVSTRYVSGTDIAQWIENSDTNADGVDDHIYGTLRRHIVDITLRGTYAIHRDLTLQAYLQPFVAVGDYEHIRRLARPRSFEFEPAAIAKDPDFNRKSFRGNVVLRWEYIRGSTLFIVWDISQEDTSRPGSFSPMRDLGDAFGATAKHVLMVKATYWMNR
jgi:hypothetical protein